MFIGMGFVLVDLFDEWVYGFYIGGYLRYVMVRIWGFWLSNVKFMVNIIFIVYLELVKNPNYLSWRIL